MIDKLWQRINNLMAHATVLRVDDSGPMQRAQIKVGYLEIQDKVPVLQHFGLATSPPVGSDVLVVYFAGDRSNGIVIGHGNGGFRPVSQGAGETTIYNALGMSIVLSAAGITINPNGHPVTINGDLRVTGSVIAGYGTAGSVNLQTHRTSGVQTGGGTSGAPVAGT